MTRPMTRPARDGGFTLTETLVAVALLALVAASAAPALRGAMTAHTRVLQETTQAGAHARLERVLRDSLAAHVPAPAGASAEALTGNAGSVRFLARPAGAETLMQVTIALEGGRSGMGVRVFAQPHGGGPVHEEIVAEGLTEARFVYFGAPEPDGVPQWYSDWTGAHPPRLVVLDMARRPRDNALRRIEAAVGGQAGFDCDYDSGRQACREGI